MFYHNLRIQKGRGNIIFSPLQNTFVIKNSNNNNTFWEDTLIFCFNIFQLDIYFKKGNSSSFQHERTHNSLTHPPMTCNTERLSSHHTGSLPARLIDGKFEKIKSVES